MQRNPLQEYKSEAVELFQAFDTPYSARRLGDRQQLDSGVEIVAKPATTRFKPEPELRKHMSKPTTSNASTGDDEFEQSDVRNWQPALLLPEDRNPSPNRIDPGARFGRNEGPALADSLRSEY